MTTATLEFPDGDRALDAPAYRPRVQAIAARLAETMIAIVRVPAGMLTSLTSFFARLIQWLTSALRRQPKVSGDRDVGPGGAGAHFAPAGAGDSDTGHTHGMTEASAQVQAAPAGAERSEPVNDADGPDKRIVEAALEQAEAFLKRLLEAAQKANEAQPEGEAAAAIADRPPLQAAAQAAFDAFVVKELDEFLTAEFVGQLQQRLEAQDAMPAALQALKTKTQGLCAQVAALEALVQCCGTGDNVVARVRALREQLQLRLDACAAQQQALQNMAQAAPPDDSSAVAMDQPQAEPRDIPMFLAGGRHRPADDTQRPRG